MANTNTDSFSTVEGEYDTITRRPESDRNKPGLNMAERTAALDELASFMAEQLTTEERRYERGKNFRRNPVSRLKFQEKQVAPVVEKIKQKYSYSGCPECERRYKIFEAVVLRGEDPSKCASLRHVCGVSARRFRRRKAYEQQVKPVSLDSDRRKSSFDDDSDV